MRTLVLSDLHANWTALKASLQAAEGRWDRVVCLGDVVVYGPDPNEVASWVRESGAVTIRGNHDKAVAELMPTDDFNPVDYFDAANREHGRRELARGMRQM